MSAGIYNITLEQGADFAVVFTCTGSDNVTPINFTGATIITQIRNQVDGSLVGQFTVTNGGTNGVITNTLLGITSKNYVTGTHKYDTLVIYSNGVRQRLMEGYCIIDPDQSVA